VVGGGSCPVAPGEAMPPRGDPVLSGPGGAGLELRALGDGLSACPDWRARGLPRLALMATPAVWQGDRLVSAPLAGLAAGYWAEIDQSRSDFAASLFSH